jgi:hypothetical protein
MPTLPLGDDLIEKLSGATAWRFRARLRQKFTPRFFCCTDPNELGISDGKEPVAVLEATPNPVFPGDNVSFDGSNSYDADGSVTGYAWTFESGTPSSSSSASGTVSWADPGVYEVTLVVTDGTGKKSAVARVAMVVLDPGGAYFIATSTGVYFTDDGGQNWTAKNTGLSGDALAVNDIKIDPATQHLAHARKTIWIATDGGLYVSNDGGGNWVQKDPDAVSNNWSDTPAPAVGDLAFVRLHFQGAGLWAIANWLNGSSEERSWLFVAPETAGVRTDTDAPVTWSDV